MAGAAAGLVPVANDPGCVKTPEARDRLEWSSSNRSKMDPTCELSSPQWQSERISFYRFFARPRFHTTKVESRCGAVALGRTYLLPPLSSGGALVVPPWLRFHIPLIEPDRQISRIRLSDKTSRFRVQRHLQLLNIYWS